MKKILHIITGIGTGGAERVLHNILSKDNNNDHFIISLKKKNFIKTPYDFNRFKVIYLNLSIYNFVYKFFLLIYLIKKLNPSVIQTWMYHSDFFGGLASKLAGVKNIFWNIRNSTLDKNTKFSTKIVLKINSYLSYFIPKKIISCSNVAIKIHLSLGFKKNFILIANGVEKEKNFKINKFKNILHLKKNEFIMTYVGRWHDQKDFETLFKALKSLKYLFKQTNWKILIAGYDLDQYNPVFYNLIKFNNLATEVKLVGQLKKVKDLYKISDLNLLSSSYGEAFPNVILEAMSHGVPCVATNVGETKYIISNYGWCVNAKEPYKFAKCISEAINLKKNLKTWKELKFNCKLSVNQRFGMDKMILKYNNVWNNS